MTHFGDPECRVTVMGKEVLLDGHHFADGGTPEIAEGIALALVYIGLPYHKMPAPLRAKLDELLA